MAEYHQGFYRPKNPGKYRGDITKIKYRSGYELKFMAYLDNHPSVISWSSEPMFIMYFSPVFHKWRRYYPDFKVKMRRKNGTIETLIIEIKPYKETVEPVPSRNKKTRIYEQATWTTNTAKWDAIREYCADRSITFKILTEKELGINYGKENRRRKENNKFSRQTSRNRRSRRTSNRKKSTRG